MLPMPLLAHETIKRALRVEDLLGAGIEGWFATPDVDMELALGGACGFITTSPLQITLASDYQVDDVGLGMEEESALGGNLGAYAFFQPTCGALLRGDPG